MKISILITNYNKYKYLKKTLNYVLNQNFKDYEIILFDDQSTDRSVDYIKKFKKRIKLIRNKKKKIKFSPLLNQNNAIMEAFKVSRGQIICLMDADDIFFKNKLFHINNYFNKNKDKNFVINYPQSKKINSIDKINSKKNAKWSFVFPTSCISFRRDFFKKFIKYSRFKEFRDLGIDARLIIFAEYYCNDHNIIKSRLNNYTVNESGNYTKYKHLGINWWISRNEAFEYLKYILKLKNIKFIKTIDYYLTKIIYNIIKISL